MNELESQTEEEHSPKTFAELEAELGEGTPDELPAGIIEFTSIEDLKEMADEDGNIEAPPVLDLNEIAEVAHNTVHYYTKLMWPGRVYNKLYEDLDEATKHELKILVHEIMSTGSNPNDMEVARVKHAHRAMGLLKDGYKWSEHDETADGEYYSPLVAPWEFLPQQHRMPILLFRDVARRLVLSVWSGT